MMTMTNKQRFLLIVGLKPKLDKYKTVGGVKLPTVLLFVSFCFLKDIVD